MSNKQLRIGIILVISIAAGVLAFILAMMFDINPRRVKYVAPVLFVTLSASEFLKPKQK